MELLTLAHLHSNPGAYALLIGAGTSYSSGIPVAWGVLVDLCRQVARAEGVDLGQEAPEKWWERTRGEEPTYGRLLERLAKTPALRQALLENYFEVAAEEREAGLKQPTAAHHGIARLVADGAIKVIITLNFDRLIEQALRAAGIEPTVITHPSEVDGMRPLHQLDCVVIHLHGDYKNPDSMLNTDAELERYASQTQKLIERILDDYGLLVAGWSATYDIALRAAIEARHNFVRYPLAWIEPFALSEAGSALLQLKRGTLLQTTADDAFARLADAVTALRTRGAAHPLTVPVAVATAKRELSGRSVAVGVHDALASAFSDLHQHPDFLYSDSKQEQEAGGYGAILARIEESVRLPAALTATLAYWGGAGTQSWWAPELERFSYRSRGDGLIRLLSVRRVAGLWLFYAAGVSAVATGRWKALDAMLRTTVTHPHRSNNRMSLAEFYEPEQIYYEHAPAGRELFAKLSPLLIETLALSPTAIEDVWQRFEVLRIAAGISARDRFASALVDLETAANQVALRERAWEEANRTGGDVGGAQTLRFEAHQHWSKKLGVLVNMGTFGRVHVLTADRMHPDDHHVAVQAQKLFAEVETAQDSHPFIEAGMYAEVGALLAVLEAVSRGLGRVGGELAWSRLPRGGGAVPMTMWLDTAETIDERGTLFVPD
ncbi:SIR2 family protein [Occultella kanbiaonis]|uniref:SIR2 family protein n=1 Tax=Occultella kanbiaonis TaxID=2675754 RepID=UPI0012B8305D|nr:SIR2 family protein [Occultella kanbiaonis]